MNLSQRAQPGQLIRTNGDKVYYNITIAPDGENSLSGEPVPAEYSDVRTTPIFYEQPDHFTLSVVRFSIPTSEIPLQIFPVDLNPPNVNINQGLPSVTLEWNNIPRQRFTSWITQRPNSLIPATLALARDTRYTEYYSVYSIDHLLRIYNEAFENAYFDILADGAPVTAPPFFQYDPVTNLISLYVPENYDAANVGIYVNNMLGRNFGNSFLQSVLGYGIVAGQDIQLIYDFTGFNIVDNIRRDVYPVQNYLFVTQEYNTLALFSSFAGLVLTTSSIPIRNEWVSATQANFPGDQQPANNRNNFFNILTDFELNQTDGYKLGSYVNYTPTAEYRRHTLNSTTPIFKIDLKVYWRDTYSNLRELFVPAQNPLTVKLLFEKK